MNRKKLYQILDICSSQEDVKADVIKNYNNNIWWPLDIVDYRKRLLIAGLSTRISYHMIATYTSVIEKINEYSYEEIAKMEDWEFIKIIKPLGLINTRMKYVKSMIEFITKFESKICDLDNDRLIELIAKNVNGASYKVAQCCVLYIKNYHCGIMPVDSGMKDMTLPCIGFSEQKSGIGHEFARKELESAINELDLKFLIDKNEYQRHIILEDGAYNWWAHLVLIYYKRHYCNKHKPEKCPINRTMCTREKCKRK